MHLLKASIPYMLPLDWQHYRRAFGWQNIALVYHLLCLLQAAYTVPQCHPPSSGDTCLLLRLHLLQPEFSVHHEWHFVSLQDNPS